ncbi:HD domain-containing protein [Candidatus Omnitrophota bacterium]
MNTAVKEISAVFKALSFAALKHSSQRRKDKSATPYINHPIDVAYILWEIGKVRDLDIITAAILHDTLEDTDTTAEEIDAQFGVKIRKIVEEVSDDKNLPKEERKQYQIDHTDGLSFSARNIKLADKICNIEDLIESPPVDWSEERMIDYAVWGYEVVKKLKGTNLKLERFFEGLYSTGMVALRKKK